MPLRLLIIGAISDLIAWRKESSSEKENSLTGVLRSRSLIVSKKDLRGGELRLKEWVCVEVGHHKRVAETI